MLKFFTRGFKLCPIVQDREVLKVDNVEVIVGKSKLVLNLGFDKRCALWKQLSSKPFVHCQKLVELGVFTRHQAL